MRQSTLTKRDVEVRVNTLQNARSGGFRAESAWGRARALGLAGSCGWAAMCAACSSEGEGAATPGMGTELNGTAPGSPAAGGSSALEGQGDDTDNASPPEPGATGSEGLQPGSIENIGDAPTPSGSGAGGAAPTSSSPVPSSGCGQVATLASGAQSLEVAGVTRTYVLDIPGAYTGSTPYPIVFAFHGATTSGQFFRSTFYGNLLSTMGDEAIVVHPDALGDPTSWNNQADLPFFDALLAQLSSSLCIDAERVFATGHSSGGFFTNTLGCQRGDVLRGIAPVSAGGPFVFGGASCTGSVAVWLAHAENDETVTFDNGEASRDRWLEANACAETSAPISPEPCQEYSGCDDGAPVRWCVYQDGHNWPEFAPQGIWDFFSSL